MKKKILGLIPTRLNSTRLPQKALLEIKNIPLVVHTFKISKFFSPDGVSIVTQSFLLFPINPLANGDL